MQIRYIYFKKNGKKNNENAVLYIGNGELTVEKVEILDVAGRKLSTQIDVTRLRLASILS